MTQPTPGSSGGGSPMKACRKCGEIKPSSDFTPSKGRCRPCVREDRRENPDRARRRNREAVWRSKNPLSSLLRSARYRCSKSGIPCTITARDLTMPAVCPVFRRPFHMGPGLDDMSPSLDRLVPELGYTPGNVVVVSWRANRLKNNATLEDLRSLVDFYELVLPSKPRWQRSPA